MKSCIVWRGPSAFDGSPIVALVVWDSRNSKVVAEDSESPVAQLYILPADSLPEATPGVCGDCPFRFGRCYAWRQKGVLSIRAKAQDTDRPYPDLDLDSAVSELTRGGYFLRLGAAGDPAALPYEVVARLAGAAIGHTGYTHAWRKCDTRFATMCMASVESEQGMVEAHSAGWRTFRVRAVDANGAAEPVVPGAEVICPASHERDVTTCDRCRLCRGTSHDTKRSVAIIDHGASALARRRHRAMGDLRVVE